MTKEFAINIAVAMGYRYDEHTQPAAPLANGILSFDGFEEQRVTIYLNSEDPYSLYHLLGRGLIKYGELRKIKEIKKQLNITQ